MDCGDGTFAGTPDDDDESDDDESDDDDDDDNDDDESEDDDDDTDALETTGSPTARACATAPAAGLAALLAGLALAVRRRR